ncbi:ABC transporter ATP-binding protein [Komagataeibacter europaeus]|uniref:ABC transporter ATP-binding protein n=1 Tax=Komagataeibacter europaeus TaxID=33995 RepID=UPI0038D10262
MRSSTTVFAPDAFATPPSQSTRRARLTVASLFSAQGGPFTFDVAAGECVTISGPSGSGKSVLLRMIADLDPHEGDCLLDGVACSGMPVAAWRRLVQYVPAEPGWWSDHVLDHMPDSDDVRGLMVDFGLAGHCLQTPLSRLSTGERQRLALLRAILLHPGVLLLDEPCSALDETSTGRVERVLQALQAQGTAIVLVSHDMRQAGRMGDRHFRMHAGRLAGITP